MCDGMTVPFPDELLHLEEINMKLKEALEKAEESVRKSEREYMDTKRYMVEHRGDIDPHEMFQNEMLLKQTDRSGAFAVERRDRIAKIKESPYFARIDFREESRKTEDRYYIGRFAFNYENQPLIFDWRAPISGMFYDFNVGKAGFQAPDGPVFGEITRKRQFKIKNGHMEYALETSSHVQDEVLQKELSQTSDEKMKSIISTIQKEQNRIIRNEKEGTMIIQGAAGSGKTSIALHRIAFLLYRFKDRLNARNVTILSPNRVFGDYISNVIPELGEEPIFELNLSELAKIQLEGLIEFEPDKDPLERQDEAWAQRVQFKSTMEFVSMMDRYIEQLPDLIFKPADFVFGSFTAEGEWIMKRFRAYSKYPVRKRLLMVAEDIRDRYETEAVMEAEGAPLRTRTVAKSLGSMLTMKNTLAVYKDFYKRTGNRSMLVMPFKKTLEWADVYPFLYLHSVIEGVKESSLTKHLVVDEMQDYTPVQYAALNRMFPCQKTILGDFGQFINPNHLHSLADLQELYKEAEFVELNKSYRSTYEIISFAKRIQEVAALEPVERHGEQPELIACQDTAEEIRVIKEAIQKFRKGGSASLGIILKTNILAGALYNELGGSCEANLLTPESSVFRNGVTITSVQMSKGLEFDEVLIPQADDRTYSSRYDRSLLYIACTRAMHRLTLTYTGRITPLAVLK